MKILVVEDEVKTGNYLKQGLLEAGFGVDSWPAMATMASTTR